MEPSLPLNEIKSFPVKDFQYSVKKVRCHMASEINPGKDFQKCPTCGVYCKYSNLPVLRSARLTFDEGQVLFYDAQLREYTQMYKINIEDENEFTENILKDVLTKTVINIRNICVCILESE